MSSIGGVRGDDNISYTLPLSILSGWTGSTVWTGPSDSWKEVTEEVSEHYMVTILFTGSTKKYSYRTTTEFEVGEVFEMKRGGSLRMVEVVHLSPPREDVHFRHKWITFVPELFVYEAEV